MNGAPTDSVSDRSVFVTGASGYIGQRLVPALLRRGHAVKCLVRPRAATSAARMLGECEIITGNPLDAASFAERVAPASTFVQLVGAPHPAPWKAAAFAAIDLPAGLAGLAAARAARARHFVYLSVAQPAPVMRAYQSARAAVESELRQAASSDGMAVTILRPWYVLGPGRQWPGLFSPLYRILEGIPATRALALRTGLVDLHDLIASMVATIESPPFGVRILDVPAIRNAARATEATPGAPTQATTKV